MTSLCLVSSPPSAACSNPPQGQEWGAVLSGPAHLDPVHASLYLLKLHADLTVPNVAESGEREGGSGRGAGLPLRLGNLPSPSPASSRYSLPHSLSFSWLCTDTDPGPDPRGQSPRSLHPEVSCTSPPLPMMLVTLGTTLSHDTPWTRRRGSW